MGPLLGEATQPTPNSWLSQDTFQTNKHSQFKQYDAEYSKIITEKIKVILKNFRTFP